MDPVVLIFHLMAQSSGQGVLITLSGAGISEK